MMDSAKRNGLLIAISIGLGCLSAWAIEQHLSAKEHELERQNQTERVVRIVAARDLPRGTLVSLKDFAKDEFPVKWVGTDAIALSEVHLAQGKQLTVDLKAGQLLMHVHLIEPAQPALASRLSPDMRAVTIPVDLLSSMSGLLQPGDRVDLFVSFEYKGQRNTAALLQGIEVLATGQQTKMTEDRAAPSESRYSTVTLAASHAQATKLVAARQGGTITAVLSHETADPLTLGAQITAAQLPELLGLESPKPPASIEIIYGDRLTQERPPTSSADWSDFAGMAPPKETP
ncbi:MAG: Flp pilus assembly protein CpaB [Alcaligenaceae bacterium]